MIEETRYIESWGEIQDKIAGVRWMHSPETTPIILLVEICMFVLCRNLYEQSYMCSALMIRPIDYKLKDILFNSYMYMNE